jgi:hypothetical protein
LESSPPRIAAIGGQLLGGSGDVADEDNTQLSVSATPASFPSQKGLNFVDHPVAGHVPQHAIVLDH